MDNNKINDTKELLLSSTTNLFDSLKLKIETYFDKDQFPKDFISYITHMIIEESPENYHDVEDTLKYFLLDKLKYSIEDTKEISKEVMNYMISIGYRPERKVIVADKLKDSISLNNIQVGSENKILSLNFDPNLLTREKQVQSVKVSEKEKFNKEISEDFRKHMEEIQKAKSSIPEITMHHDRDESYKVDIRIENFTISIGGKTLLEDADLKISFGRRYVLIGRNGIGKTTLLNYFARKELENIPKHLQILHVQQETVANNTPLLEEVLKCDVERSNLLKESKELNEKLEISNNSEKKLTDKEIKSITDRLIEVETRLQLIGVDEAETNAIEILKGLGFSDKDLQKPTNQFSGGWRMRISLAKSLFVQPDILLLDEPTNHLDMNAVMWLEDYLISWPYTVIVVSHARDFINNVATDIMLLQNSKITYYKGNYDDFEKARADKMKHLKKQKESQDKQISHMNDFINRFRANAKRASLVQSRIKALNKIDIIEQIAEDPTCVFMFPNPEPLNPPLLKLDGVNLGYSNTVPILKNVDFALDMSSRIAVVGPNGAGKTTLLKAVTGELEPMSGKNFRHPKLKLAMFTQHHIDQLNMEYTPIEQIASMYGDIPTEKIRSHLASFGISGNLMMRPNYLLSGGQKTRVALAALIYSKPQIILMDEPTNHLDIDAVNALALALNNYSGGICIVSHDQHFVESVCERIYVVQDQKVFQFKGNFGEYKKYLKKMANK